MKKGLRKDQIYKLNMKDVRAGWVKGQIYDEAILRPEFQFLCLNTVPRAWPTWAIDGSIKNVSQWMKDNPNTLDTPRRKRTYDYSAGSIGALPPPKKQKIAAENAVFVSTYFLALDGNKVEWEIPIRECIKPGAPVTTTIGRGRKHSFNYGGVSFTMLRRYIVNEIDVVLDLKDLLE